ncbi:DUF4270 domain-containing protein [Flavobacterium sp. 14A]|uniref:DUF4270 domain-containing protein n=1 Tax=Flavobacterium sp. 14A TaxID=2735896 RepID=UPI00156D4A33|nr:DUF4270 domain-containing protein [Flavobacterium sp. 14A]NRT12980.1 hypothetical protein [Flavobacterium sp. 14A]
MFNSSFFKKILLASVAISLFSCDKDINTIGDGIVGDDHFGFEKLTSEVVAYNQKISAVQSNNLPVNALGIYDTEAFGTTTANFNTQVALQTVAPTFGNNPVIESVVLTIPYFSVQKSIDVNGDSTYELDSIYGPSDAKIKLSVYESGYFMRALDPDTGLKETQKYYTDQNADFDNVKVGARLNNSTDVTENDAFVFSAAEYKSSVTTDGVTTVTRTKPGMRLNLNKSYFKTKIIDAATSGKLATADTFRDYFRGLYFKVEKSGSSPSALAMLNFREGKITINYKEDTSVTDNSRVDKSVVINLTGNTVSLLQESNSKPAYTAATTNANKTTGDEKLYLKGGQGSMAIVELFGKDLYGSDGKTGAPNGVADELDVIRSSGWLINEASLVFHADGTTSGNDAKVNRIYLYDVDNSTVVRDHSSDNTTATSIKSGKIIFSGLLNKTSESDNTYKIRITDQIRNLIQNQDSTNVRLGVVVTEDINTISVSKLKVANSTIEDVATASVMSPQGVVLYGSKAVNADKRLKLEIYYTKSNK